jgi:hypothetical protein
MQETNYKTAFPKRTIRMAGPNKISIIFYKACLRKNSVRRKFVLGEITALATHSNPTLRKINISTRRTSAR